MSDQQEIDAIEKGFGTLRKVDSALTLTNSSYPSSQLSLSTTPQRSGDPSIKCSTKSEDTSTRQRFAPGKMKPLYKGAQTTHRFFYHELESSWMGIVIIVCFFTSGLIDSVAFNSWNCFVGMQTGWTLNRPREVLTDISYRQYRLRCTGHRRSAYGQSFTTMVQVSRLHRFLLHRHSLLQRNSPMAHEATKHTYVKKEMDLLP